MIFVSSARGYSVVDAKSTYRVFRAPTTILQSQPNNQQMTHPWKTSITMMPRNPTPPHTNQADQHLAYKTFLSFKQERAAMFKLAENNANPLSVSKQYFHDALASCLTHLPTTEHTAISERFSSYQKQLFSNKTKLRCGETKRRNHRS
jgi:hypothetical protein